MDIIADNEGNSQLDIDDASYVEGNFINKTFVMILHTLLYPSAVFAVSKIELEPIQILDLIGVWSGFSSHCI